MKYTYTNQLPDLPLHYFAGNARRWEVSENPEALIKSMKASKLDFVLYMVKLDIKTPYQIKNGAPVLQDDQYEYLGTWMID